MLLCNFGSTGEPRCCLNSILYCCGSETAQTSLALHIQKLKVGLHEPSWVATSVSAWESLCQVQKACRWKPGASEVRKNPAIKFKRDQDSAGLQSQTLFHPQQFKWNFMPVSTTKSVCSWKTWRTWKTSQPQLIHIIIFCLPQMSKCMLLSPWRFLLRIVISAEVPGFLDLNVPRITAQKSHTEIFLKQQETKKVELK